MVVINDIKIVSNEEIAKNIFLLTLKSNKLFTSVKPGQFILIYKLEKTFFPRPFSISEFSHPFLKVIYKVRGEGTKQLSLKTDTLKIAGPFGNGFKIYKNHTPLLIAGGLGIATLLPIINYYKKGVIFYGAKTKDEIIDIKIKNYQTHIATEDGSLGEKSTVIELFKGKVPKVEIEKFIIYSAGSKKMLSELKKVLNTLNLKVKVEVSLEEVIACGTGECRGCVIKTVYGYKTVCKDGPIFDLSEVVLF